MIYSNVCTCYSFCRDLKTMNTAKGENTLLIWHSSTNSKVPGCDGRNIQNKIHHTIITREEVSKREKSLCEV